MIQCSIDIMEIYPNQTFNEESFKKGYEAYFESENSASKELWTPVVEATFKTCLELSTKFF